MKAIFNEKIIAESDATVFLENNNYFPIDSIELLYFSESNTKSTCPWKGTVSYFTIDVDGEKNIDTAWYYPNPSEKAKAIKGYVAFWKGVKVIN